MVLLGAVLVQVCVRAEISLCVEETSVYLVKRHVALSRVIVKWRRAEGIPIDDIIVRDELGRDVGTQTTAEEALVRS